MRAIMRAVIGEVGRRQHVMADLVGQHLAARSRPARSLATSARLTTTAWSARRIMAKLPVRPSCLRLCAVRHSSGGRRRVKRLQLARAAGQADCHARATPPDRLWPPACSRQRRQRHHGDRVGQRRVIASVVPSAATLVISPQIGAASAWPRTVSVPFV